MNKVIIGIVVVLLLISTVSAVTITKVGLKNYLRDELKKYYENNESTNKEDLARFLKVYNSANSSDVDLDNAGIGAEAINRIKEDSRYSKYIKGEVGNYTEFEINNSDEIIDEFGKNVTLKDLKEKCKSDDECESGKCLSPAASLIGYLYIWHKECVKPECKIVRKGIWFRTLDCSGN